MFSEDQDTTPTKELPFVADLGLIPSLPDAKPIDLWDAWVYAEAESGVTLEAWNMAATEDKAGARAAYRAALDREERAAHVLAERLGQGRRSPR